MGTIDKLKFAEDVAKKSEKYGFPTSEKSKKRKRSKTTSKLALFFFANFHFGTLF